MWRKDFTGKIHTTFSPLRLTDIARYVKRTDRIPHIRLGSCGAGPDVPPAPPYDLPSVAAQKKAHGNRARMVWLRRVKSALRPHGLPPHEKRYASVVSSRRIKSALRTRAPPWPVVACSECATGARPFLPIAAPPLDTRPYFFTQAAKTVRKRFTNARACDIILWQFGDMAQLVERCVRNA